MSNLVGNSHDARTHLVCSRKRLGKSPIVSGDVACSVFGCLLLGLDCLFCVGVVWRVCVCRRAGGVSGPYNRTYPQ